MKKILLTFGLALASLAVVNAQDTLQTEPQNQQEMIEGEGIEMIEKSDIPQAVTDGMENSEFKGAEVMQAFIISGDALDQQLGDQSVEKYIGDQYPEKLYQIQVTSEDVPAVVYFTEEGELYASKKTM